MFSAFSAPLHPRRCARLRPAESSAVCPLRERQNSRRWCMGVEPLNTLEGISKSNGTIASRKSALHDAIAGLDLGRAILDDKPAQAEVDKLICSLEAENPTPNPADDPLRRARWRLLYTTSPLVLGRGRPGFSTPKRCWQTLDIDDDAHEGKLKNEEEASLSLFGWELKWRNQVLGKFKSLRGVRFRIRFETFTLGNLIRVPFPGAVVVWQDQTFLDEQMRIARTNYGNVFVMERDEQLS